MQKLPRRVKVVTETVPQLAVGTKQTKISFNAEVNLKKKRQSAPKNKTKSKNIRRRNTQERSRSLH